MSNVKPQLSFHYEKSENVTRHSACSPTAADNDSKIRDFFINLDEREEPDTGFADGFNYPIFCSEAVV